MSQKLNRNHFLAIMLALTALFLLNLNMSKNYENFKIEKPTNIQFDKSSNTLNLSSLTLRQKIAQMIITNGELQNKEILQNLLIGGIYIGSLKSKEEYIKVINEFQRDAIIPFFVTTDLEGCINTLENVQSFPSLNKIKSKEEAYQLGYEHGKLLKELGFNINFAPVLDLTDNIWECRSFSGTAEEIAEKGVYYIKGLQENGIIATAKHYPGKTLYNNDPHHYVTYATIDENDTLPFIFAINNGVKAIMVSWIVVNGTLDSEGKPAACSEKIIKSLREKFDGLIITDDVSMLGVRDFYKGNLEKMYIDLFKAGNDIIINLKADMNEIIYIIDTIERAVKRGEISENRIDESVIRILKAKGINVVK